MRQIFSSALMALCLFGTVCPLGAAEQAAVVQNQAQTVTLDVRNMTCPMCKFTIRKALKDVEGVVDTKVDYDSKTAAVTFDPQKATVDDLIRASTNAGYPASVKPDQER